MSRSIRGRTLRQPTRAHQPARCGCPSWPAPLSFSGPRLSIARERQDNAPRRARTTTTGGRRVTGRLGSSPPHDQRNLTFINTALHLHDAPIASLTVGCEPLLEHPSESELGFVLLFSPPRRKALYSDHRAYSTEFLRASSTVTFACEHDDDGGFLSIYALFISLRLLADRQHPRFGKKARRPGRVHRLDHSDTRFWSSSTRHDANAPSRPGVGREPPTRGKCAFQGPQGCRRDWRGYQHQLGHPGTLLPTPDVVYVYS